MISKHQHAISERKKQKAQAKLEKTHKMPKNVSFANMVDAENPHGNIWFAFATYILPPCLVVTEISVIYAE